MSVLPLVYVCPACGTEFWSPFALPIHHSIAHRKASA